MEKSVLIITQGSRYGKKIVDKFLKNNYKVIKTGTKQEEETSETTEAETEGKLTELNWNFTSQLSFKNIILCLKNYPDITDVIILYSVPEDNTPVYNQSYVEMQKTIDLYIKGQLSITCDLLREFSKNNSQCNFFLVLEKSPLSNPFREFFKSFINSLLEDNNLPLVINAFEVGKDTPESFADYAFSIIQDKKQARGKWFKQFRYTLF